MTERPLIDHLADKLNEIEQTEGKIHNVTVIDQQEDKWAEVLVNVDKETN